MNLAITIKSSLITINNDNQWNPRVLVNLPIIKPTTIKGKCIKVPTKIGLVY